MIKKMKDIANNIDYKSHLKDSAEIGIEIAKDGVSSIIWSVIIKVGVGVVLIVGATTATIYGIGALFN